jgi:hypothetical protein
LSLGDNTWSSPDQSPHRVPEYAECEDNWWVMRLLLRFGIRQRRAHAASHDRENE